MWAKIKKSRPHNRQRTGKIPWYHLNSPTLHSIGLKRYQSIPRFYNGNSRCSLLKGCPCSVHCSQKVFGHASVIASQQPATLFRLSRAYLFLLKRICYLSVTAVYHTKAIKSRVLQKFLKIFLFRLYFSKNIYKICIL